MQSIYYVEEQVLVVFVIVITNDRDKLNFLSRSRQKKYNYSFLN